MKMLYNRHQRRKIQKASQGHLDKLATLLGNFYEFLGASPQPSDDEVRERFQKANDEWKRYCFTNKLMNATHLFTTNVREAWARHANKDQLNQQ